MRFLASLSVLLAGCASLPNAAPAPRITTAAVPLLPGDASSERLGRLRYLGGLELRSPTFAASGLSSLRWHGGRLHAVVDQGGWVSFAPVERGGRLIGLADVRAGRLSGEDGQPLAGWRRVDAEALAHDGSGWLVGFEHDHRILRYATLDSPPAPSHWEPAALFGALEDNQGIETIAIRDGRSFLCAERLPTAGPNCALIDRDGTITRIALAPPPALDQQVGFPTDADFGADGTVYVLFRSWSGGRDNRAAVVARHPDGRAETLAVLVPPYPVDNMEGIAVREERGRTFLYLISDDNFSRRERPDRPETWQRALLLKFELVREDWDR